MSPLEKDAILYAKTGKLEKFKSCLDAGVPASFVDDGKQSLLMHAASRNHLPVVEELLRRGADANFVGRYDNSTALFQAREAGHAELAALLEAHTSQRKGYTIEPALRCENSWSGYCMLHDAIWNDFQRGRKLNDHEYTFLSLHPFLTRATGWGYEDMLSNRGYWNIPHCIRLLETVGETHYAAIQRRADEIIRRHAKRIGYDLVQDAPQEFKWDQTLSSELEALEEEVQFWNMSQAEYDRLARKALDYVREHREHFTDGNVGHP